MNCQRRKKRRPDLDRFQSFNRYLSPLIFTKWVWSSNIFKIDVVITISPINTPQFIRYSFLVIITLLCSCHEQITCPSSFACRSGKLSIFNFMNLY